MFALCMFIFWLKLKYKKVKIEYNNNQREKNIFWDFVIVILTPLCLFFIYYDYDYALFGQTLKIIPSTKRCEVLALHRIWQGYEATSGNYVLEYSYHQVSEIVWLMTRGSSTYCLVVGIY